MISEMTIPAAANSVELSYSVSGGKAVLELPDDKVADILTGSKGGEVDIGLSGVENISSAELPKSALSAFGEAGLGLLLKIPQGRLSLNAEAAKSIVSQADGSVLDLELKEIAASGLTAMQQAVAEGDAIFDINIRSNYKKSKALTVSLQFRSPIPAAELLRLGI